jgi:hypothetical protein
LRDLRPNRVEYVLVVDDLPTRAVVVRVENGRLLFPTLESDSTETLGSDAADAEVRLRSSEELVRLRSYHRTRTVAR